MSESGASCDTHPILLRESDYGPLLTIEDWIGSCDEAFRLYGNGFIRNPPRFESVEKNDGMERFRLRMPAEWPDRWRGEKVIEERSFPGSDRPGSRVSWVELENLETGQRARVEANLLTDMRTGAAGALGARYLGPSGARTAAILGTGRVARALALCVDKTFRLEEIRVTSRRPESRGAFEESIGPLLRAPLRMVEILQACVAEADLVFCAVSTPAPILGDGPVSPLTHLSVMAGDPRTAQLEFGLLRDRPVIVDEPAQAANSGEFRIAREVGRDGEIAFARDETGRIQTIGDAANGRLESLRGRGAIAYFTGLAAQDLHAAVTIHERVRMGRM